VRERAVAANDEQIIRDWMVGKHSADYAMLMETQATYDTAEADMYDENGLNGIEIRERSKRRRILPRE